MLVNLEVRVQFVISDVPFADGTSGFHKNLLCIRKSSSFPGTRFIKKHECSTSNVTDVDHQEPSLRKHVQVQVYQKLSLTG